MKHCPCLAFLCTACALAFIAAQLVVLTKELHALDEIGLRILSTAKAANVQPPPLAIDRDSNQPSL